MAYEAILFEKRQNIGILTLNKPERLNAIGPALRAEVHACVAEAHKDDDIRVLIVTGAGRGFCSGPI
jgi:enoyl-CoA hydratase/carnithine racemase